MTDKQGIFIDGSGTDIPKDAKECWCLGPQRGEPLCPCKMKSVVVKNGRYIQDLGPVVEPPPEPEHHGDFMQKLGPSGTGTCNLEDTEIDHLFNTSINTDKDTE